LQVGLCPTAIILSTSYTPSAASAPREAEAAVPAQQQFLSSMHKTLCVLLVFALLPQYRTSTDRGNHDHTDWAEDATAEEQAKYIDSMLGLQPTWGTVPAHDVLLELWPLYEYRQAVQPYFAGVLTGLAPSKAKHLLTELGEQMEWTLQNMAAVYHCCGVVNDNHRLDTEWEGGALWPVLLRDECQRNHATSRLGRAYALAQAHAGPSRMHCHKNAAFLFNYMRHLSNLAYGMHALEETMGALNTFDAPYSMLTLVKLVAQASVPRLRGAPYKRVLRNLQDYDFLYEMTEDSWHTEGIPQWIESSGATYIPTVHHALVWVIRHSLDVLTLESFHNHVTKSADMRDCRDILNWFEDDQLFSAQGLSCVCTSRAGPLNTTGIQSDLGQLPLTDSSVLADKVSVEECHGWAECSAAFASWGCLLVCHGGVLVAVVYICWRPDLLIFWRARPKVRTPSYAGFVRQLKQQRFTAKAARQAATEGLRKQPPDSKESYRAYAVHLMLHCWCPRARFVVASFAPGLLVSLLISPVQLVVSALRVGIALLVGTVKELGSGTAKALSRICH
jgi:hypothetical protein